MKGLMLLQSELTGNLEKDRDLLLLGMGGLLVLALASLIILIFVLLRRGKNRQTAQKPPVNPAEKTIPAETTAQEKTTQPEITPITEKEQPSSESGQKENQEPETEPVQEIAEPKTPEIQEPSPEEKLEEIRRRLEEIRKNPRSGPVPVLPKVEAKKREAQTAGPTVAAQEIKPPIFEETEQITHTENKYGAELPIAGINPATAEEEAPVENPSPENDKKEENKGTFVTNKNLPMKKLTFAEWVELFKDQDRLKP
jgi:hypothetical protein